MKGKAAYELADEVIAFSTQHEFPHWVAMGLQMRGNALARLGQWEEGMQQLRQGVEAYQATGAIGGRDWALPELARGCLQRGQYDEGFRLVEEALDLTREEVKGMRHYEPEKHHAKGELLLAQAESMHLLRRQRATGQPRKAEAEACFLKAIEIAREPTSQVAGSCAPPRASLACGNNRARRPKLTRCWRRSTAGSPKALTPKTCKRRKPCWIS